MFCCFVDIIASKANEDPPGKGEDKDVFSMFFFVVTGSLCSFFYANFMITTERCQMMQAGTETDELDELFWKLSNLLRS